MLSDGRERHDFVWNFGVLCNSQVFSQLYRSVPFRDERSFRVWNEAGVWMLESSSPLG